MGDKIHAWAAKSKLNMTLLLALVAAVAVGTTAYLPAATAAKVNTAMQNVVVCGDISCTTVTAVAIPVK